MSNQKKNFSVGDTVYFESRGFIEKAKILELMEFDDQPWAKVRTEMIPSTCSQPVSALCASEQEVRDNIKAESERVKAEYRNQINSVEDLVIFLFNHDTNLYEDITDYEARAVAIEKAAELLGMSETRLLGMDPDNLGA